MSIIDIKRYCEKKDLILIDEPLNTDSVIFDYLIFLPFFHYKIPNMRRILYKIFGHYFAEEITLLDFPTSKNNFIQYIVINNK